MHITDHNYTNPLIFIMKNIKQNEAQNSLSRRAFMKQSVTATAGVVAGSDLIAPSLGD